MMHQEAERAADAGDGGARDRGAKKSDDVAQAVEAERGAEIALDQRGDDKRFAGVANGKDQSAADVSVAHEIGGDRCRHGADHRALGPSAISNPADTPAAGQNTATPSGLVRSASPNRAARK